MVTADGPAEQPQDHPGFRIAVLAARIQGYFARDGSLWPHGCVAVSGERHSDVH